MPHPLFELRRFIFILQHKFIKAFNSDLSNKGGLHCISIALFCFLERFCRGTKILIITMFVYCAGADLHPLVNVLYHTRILYHTHMVHTVRVWYVPYAYGMYYTRMVQFCIPYAYGMIIRVWYIPYAYYICTTRV